MTCHTRNPPTDDDVGGAEGAPACRDQAVHPAAVEAVKPPQRDQRDDGRHDGHRRIAASFNGVGVVENRVSMVADSDSPGGAGPIRSVNTPTIDGRRFGSANPVRRSLPVVGSVSPTKVANVPASVDVISMRWHCGDTTRARGTLRDHDVAVGDVHPLARDVDEQRVERGLLAALRRGAEHHPAARRHRSDHIARHRRRHRSPASARSAAPSRC